MIDKKIQKKVEKVLKEFFKKSTFEVDCKIGEFRDNNLKIDLQAEQAEVLIGPQGKTLHSLQVILGRIVRKQFEEHIYLDIDINNYKQNKVKYLEEMAKNIADKVALNHKPETLAAMTSYERRIIHMALADRTDITTESTGDETERRVVINPA